MRKTLFSMVTLGALLSFGCGTEDTVDNAQFLPSTLRAFVYTSSAGQRIDLYSVNVGSGGASVASNNVYTGVVGNLAADPLGRYLFSSSPGGVQCFSVNSMTGLLTQTSLTPATPDEHHELVINRQGNLLYLPENGGVEAFFINRDSGNLTQAGARIAVADQLFDGAVDATNRFAYFLGNNSLQRFSIGANGVLTLLGATPLEGVSFTKSIVIDEANQNLYVLDAGTNPQQNAKQAPGDPILARADGQNQILRFGLNADGSLTAPTVTLLGPLPELYTDLATRGNLLFAAESTNAATAVYTIGAAGALTKVGANASGGGDELALIPSLPVLASSHLPLQRVSAQLVSPDGTLTLAPGTPIVNAGPIDDIAALITLGDH